MSQIYNTGPVELYTGTGSASALEFLGYSENGMQIEIRETFEDVHSDLLGPRIPTDVQHFQADALITGDLVRWNESVLEKCEDRSLNGAGGTGASFGIVSKLEVGALMLAYGKTYRLLCDAPSLDLGGAGSGAIMPGLIPLNFPYAYLHDTMTRKRGARAERVHIIFRGLANTTNIGATAALPNTFTLYNNVRTGRPGTAPN